MQFGGLFREDLFVLDTILFKSVTGLEDRHNRSPSTFTVEIVVDIDKDWRHDLYREVSTYFDSQG